MLKQCVLFASISTVAASCRSTHEESAALELENSLTVCSDLQILAVQERAHKPPEEAFRTVKRRERRILDDLILTAPASLRSGYERQRDRLQECGYQPSTAQEEQAAARRNEEKRRTLLEEIMHVEDLGDLCRIAETTILGDPQTRTCQADLLKTACYRVADGRVGTERITTAITTDYRDALVGCVRSLAGDQAALAAETFAVELKRELTQGQDLDHSLLVAACRSGAMVAGDHLHDVPQVDFNNACGSLGRSLLNNPSRIGSCLRTATDICEIFVSNGGMELDRLIPTGEAENAKETLLRNLYQGVDRAICAESPTASLACRTIGAASQQIMQAVKTGNNDWAHCVGTDQIGACLGTLWGAGGWTNNNGVAMAETNGATTYRPCCWCYKDHYLNDGWISDTRTRRENWFGVIQEGDVESGNCKQMEGKDHNGGLTRTSDGYDAYYEYAECNRWYVAGDSCHAEGGWHQVWNGTKKQWFKVSVP